MSCPTCDHTMQAVGKIDGVRLVHWCPRCGTLAAPGEARQEAVPKLVERCRQFQNLDGFTTTPGYGEVQKAWHRLGIEESINVPANRS